MERQCKGHYKDVAQYCDEIYVIQLFVREDFKMHLYRNLICFGNTIYSGGNIDILYLAIKMKLTENFFLEKSRMIISPDVGVI